MPARGLENVTYDRDAGYLELGAMEKVRAPTVNTARSFAQMLRLMAASRAMVESNDFATKREAYYISKNWGDCRFDEQADSDAIMDDIEAIASRQGLHARTFGFIPSRTAARSRGGSS
jgi:DNA topoisomerase-6 subunit A